MSVRSRGVGATVARIYTPRWGAAGRLVDRAFGPVFGWATAWSFDRLRLWLERGVPPVRARANAVRELALRALAVAGAAMIAAPAGTAAAVTATLAALIGALALPPRPDTPAARRCLRRPPDSLAARPLDGLAARPLDGLAARPPDGLAARPPDEPAARPTDDVEAL